MKYLNNARDKASEIPCHSILFFHSMKSVFLELLYVIANNPLDADLNPFTSKK